MIHHRIAVADAGAHRFRVTLFVPEPVQDLQVSLPVWIPGSYLVREFARHLSDFAAIQSGQPVVVKALDKTTWQIESAAGLPLELSYTVYAFDASVRTAFLDPDRGFFNPCSLCLRVEGRTEEAQSLDLVTLPEGWEVATAMPPDPSRRGAYLCANYDELADHPVEMGQFWRANFEACGVPHEFVVAGAWPRFDGERLLADARRICEAQIKFWHGEQPPPISRYVFMLYAVEAGYGGLEHRASTALIAPRKDLPRLAAEKASEGYTALLGLISHEYFHTWNVKRLKPAEFLRYDYSRENYSELLWFFEGFTSYYDDLMLRRAGLIDEATYLGLLGKTIHSVRSTPGQQVQSVAEASFDAWVKYYRPDENSPNSTVSYYTKGSLVALLLDLRLRAAQAGSLDSLMRRLWVRCLDTGLTEAAVLEEVAALGGSGLAEELSAWIHSRSALDVSSALEAFGVELKPEPVSWSLSLGLKMGDAASEKTLIKAVLAGSPGALSGLSSGDEVIAANGWRVSQLDSALAWVGAGEPFTLLVSRGQRILELAVDPRRGAAFSTRLVPVIAAVPRPEAQALRSAWLGA